MDPGREPDKLGEDIDRLRQRLENDISEASCTDSNRFLKILYQNMTDPIGLTSPGSRLKSITGRIEKVIAANQTEISELEKRRINILERFERLATRYIAYRKYFFGEDEDTARSSLYYIEKRFEESRAEQDDQTPLIPGQILEQMREDIDNISIIAKTKKIKKAEETGSRKVLSDEDKESYTKYHTLEREIEYAGEEIVNTNLLLRSSKANLRRLEYLKKRFQEYTLDYLYPPADDVLEAREKEKKLVSLRGGI